MNKLTIILAIVAVGMTISGNVFGANEVAEVLRSSGKIYVVVAVLSTIMIGIFLYIFLVEKKLSRMEKELKEK